MGTINGIGTMFYGQSRRDPDHSYITTEWFVIFYIPLFPLRSYRVHGESRELRQTTMFGVQDSKSHELQRIPLCWSQIKPILFRLWGCAVALATSIYVAATSANQTVVWISVFVGAAAAAIALGVVRHHEPL
jgi:hypothetical protein